jgi:Rps23 Pro-64 3,4-dihydroxylase Tpa1-like proline 4-hydroxylase
LCARPLRDAFLQSRRIHIPDFLEPRCARDLHDYLIKTCPWSLVVNSGERVFDLDATARTELGEAGEQQLMESAYRQARNGFQYVYESCRVPEEAGLRAQAPTLLCRFADFLNSAPFMDFARELTGIEDIDRADAQATRYRSGHFLGAHDDAVPGKERVAAYVLNLTPHWQAHWGGQLQFMAQDGHIDEAYVPKFNAMNVFLIRQPHLVSYVAPFAAPTARLSVTGWLRCSPGRSAR